MTDNLITINDSINELELRNERAHLLCEIMLNNIEKITQGVTVPDEVTCFFAYRELENTYTFINMLLDEVIVLEKIAEQINELSAGKKS